MSGNKYQYYTWKLFERDVKLIVAQIRAIETYRDKRFNKVYGIPRGGLVLAVRLSHALEIPLELDYSHIEPELADPLRYGRKTLIVDDIADTGNTLKPFKDQGFFVVTIFKHPESVIEPDAWIREKGKKWIVFPWETAPSPV